MLLLDDILLSPMSGILWIFREIHNTACQEIANEPEEIAQQLRLLYMQLETGGITEQEFQEHEGSLLDRLDEIQHASEAPREETPDDETPLIEEAAPAEEELVGAK